MTARHAVALLLLPLACRPAPAPPRGPAGGARHPAMSIDQVLARHADSLMALPGVVGLAHAEVDGQAVVRVLVVKLTSELRRHLPTTLDAYAVQVVETGVIEAQPGDSGP